MSVSFTGELLPNGLRHGKGTYEYPNSSFKYTGEWKQGIKQGTGRFILCDGSIYNGSFEEGEIQGEGTRKWPDGSFYSGNFVRGEMSGDGVISRQGFNYQGEFLDNKMHGQGKWECLVTGDLYHGNFLKHKRHGVGTLKCKNGSIYEGEWKEGKKHGKGKFVDTVSGITQDGKWIDDKPAVVPAHLEWVFVDADQTSKELLIQMNTNTGFHSLVQVHVKSDKGEVVTAETNRKIKLICFEENDFEENKLENAKPLELLDSSKYDSTENGKIVFDESFCPRFDPGRYIILAVDSTEGIINHLRSAKLPVEVTE